MIVRGTRRSLARQAITATTQFVPYKAMRFDQAGGEGVNKDSIVSLQFKARDRL